MCLSVCVFVCVAGTGDVSNIMGRQYHGPCLFVWCFHLLGVGANAGVGAGSGAGECVCLCGGGCR